jgi:meso-butanediol dehydrogenase/(S,S)-butanediol dehydrogenase/diacetyl reductase
MLKGRNAFITGAGGGIGRAIATHLAREGANVWLADVNAAAVDHLAADLRREGVEANALAMDVSKRSSVEQAASEVFAQWPRVDVLVANAGVSTMNHFLDLTDDEWDLNFAVNSRGTFLTIQVFARRMIHQTSFGEGEVRGKIIATASMAARRAAPLLAHYSASKFAVIGLVQAAARELAPQRITVNAVNPGFVKTSMQEREVEWEAKLRGLTPDAVRDEYVRDTPLGRLQEPEDVAKVVGFLAGSDSDFLTGEVIEVNGGAWMF